MKKSFFLAVTAPVMLAAAPALAQDAAAEPETIALSDDTVLTAIEIDHLRAFADGFEFERLLEQAEPDTVLVAMRAPDQPIFNLIASACESEDKLSDCKALVVRLLMDPKGQPFDPSLAHRPNDEFAVTKTMILDDGRLQMDRFVIIGGGVTVDNIAENIAASYSTFLAAQPIIFPEVDGSSD